MKSDIYWIKGPWPGRIAIVPRPRGGEWLSDEAQTWRAAGIDVIVSLLQDSEIGEFELALEAKACQDNGIEFLSFPIADRNVPASFSATEAFARRLDEQLAKGKNIAVHCRQGIGRSALIISCALILGGMSCENAFEAISQARGSRVPETAEQRAWVERFAQRFQVVTASKGS